VISGVAGRALEAQLRARTLWATSPNQGHHRRSERDELEAAREARMSRLHGGTERGGAAGPYCVMRRLSDEALRSGRILASLAPRDSEVHGLSALMDLQSSRLAARTAEDGSPILLLDQDRSRWDPVHIVRGLAALDRAEALATELGPYALQAAIAACHARAGTAEATDWVRIADLYERLARVTGSPVVEVNRAVALGMAYGPQAGLALLDQLDGLPTLSGYHLLPSVRGDLLDKLGRHEEAKAEFARAATMTQNERERRLLLNRASGRPAGQASP
jgi:predicted RNA polymerase sigma factor